MADRQRLCWRPYSHKRTSYGNFSLDVAICQILYRFPKTRIFTFHMANNRELLTNPVNKSHNLAYFSQIYPSLRDILTDPVNKSQILDPVPAFFI